MEVEGTMEDLRLCSKLGDPAGDEVTGGGWGAPWDTVAGWGYYEGLEALRQTWWACSKRGLWRRIEGTVGHFC